MSHKHLLYIHNTKTGPFVISSYLCFDSYELHENFQKYLVLSTSWNFHAIRSCQSKDMMK